MRDDELIALAKQIATTIESQPKDGLERSISVTIGGRNEGHITIGGTQVVVSNKDERRTWADLSDAELRQELDYWQAQWWSGWRGYWLNLPSIALLLMLGAMAVGLMTGWLLTSNLPYWPYPLIAVAVTISGLSVWLVTIRRVEGQHMILSRSHIDAITSEIRRRRR